MNTCLQCRVFILLSLFLVVRLVPAQEPTESSATLDFVGADIESVARAIGHYTGNTFVIDPRVKGTINLVSEHAINKQQAMELLSSILRLQDFTLVRTPNYIKIVPEADAKLQAAPTQIGKQRVDQIATEVYVLNHQSANSLVTVLRPLISPNNTIAADTVNNTLVITDYVDNLKRLARIIATLDTPANAAIEVITLEHAIAMDLAVTVNRLLDSGSTPTAPASQTDSGRVLVLADARTNSLIIRAPNAARVNLARALISKLDQPTTLPGNVHVVYLRNAEATKLAQVLRAVVASESSTASSSTVNPTASISSQPAAASSPGSVLQTAPPSASPAQSPLPTGGAAGYIQADPSTNTLIITANDKVYRNLRVIIDQLDARRAQVYVESLIVEINADRAAQLGVQWAGLSGMGAQITASAY